MNDKKSHSYFCGYCLYLNDTYIRHIVQSWYHLANIVENSKAPSFR